MFFECDSTKSSWEQLNKHYHDDLSLPSLTPYPAFSTLIKNKLNAQIKNKQIINHILLLLKLYIYKSWNKHRLNINNLSANILKIIKNRKRSAANSKNLVVINKNEL